MNDRREGVARTRKGAEQWKWENGPDGQMKPEWAEKIVIGTLLVHGEKYIDVLDSLVPSSFTDERCRIIFETIAEITKESIPLTMVAVVTRLDETRRLAEFEGGTLWVAELFDQSELVSTTHFANWADIIARNAAKLRVRQQLSDMLLKLNRGTDLEGIIDQIAKLSNTMPSGKKRRDTNLAESALEYVKTLGAKIGDEAMFQGIPDIDMMIGGVAPGEVVVVAARPGMGKTMLALQWLDCARLKDVSSLIISQEMTAAELMRRGIQRITEVERSQWHNFPDQVRKDVEEHFSHQQNIIISEGCGHVDAMERAIDRAVLRNRVKIVAIDYCQLIRGHGSSKQEQVSDVSMKVKQLAIKHKISVILLAQLNRAIEGRGSGAVPTAADIRDSGQIEQDADIILFPVWTIKSDPSFKNPNHYRIYQVKNRNRGVIVPMIEMRIVPERQRLESANWSDGELPDDVADNF